MSAASIGPPTPCVERVKSTPKGGAAREECSLSFRDDLARGRRVAVFYEALLAQDD